MNRDEIGDKVRALLVEELGVDAAKVTPSANLENDLGADSLDVVGIVMETEDAFDVEIADDEAVTIKTVEQLVDLIEQKLG